MTGRGSPEEAGDWLIGAAAALLLSACPDDQCVISPCARLIYPEHRLGRGGVDAGRRGRTGSKDEGHVGPGTAGQGLRRAARSEPAGRRKYTKRSAQYTFH